MQTSVILASSSVHKYATLSAEEVEETSGDMSEERPYHQPLIVRSLR